MKKLYFGLLAAFCCTLFFASCSDDNGEGDDVVNESIYGTWLSVRDYGEDEEGPWEEDMMENGYRFYVVYNEDGTGKTIENSGSSWTGNFTWTLDGRNLTTTYSYGADYEKDYYYIRKLTANEMELYSEGDGEWWCEVYVRADKEL